MSAANLIVGRRAAYIIADCAGYDDDGHVRQLGRKVEVNDALRMAITNQGWQVPTRAHRRLAAWFSEQETQERALAGLPALLDELVAMMQTEDAEQPGLHAPILQLYIATWSLARRRPECFVMTSSAEGALPSHVAPGRLHSCVEYISPQVPGFSSWPKFNPHVDGRRLIEAQRFVPSEHGHYVVGGGGHLATVDAEGARIELLCTWPDRIGCKIDPTRSWNEGWRAKLRRMLGQATPAKISIGP